MVKHYIIYKITNQINSKYYIGRHATNDVNDSYMGSGIGIKNAIAKYGVENFTKEIIATADSTDALWDLELEIVNEEVVKDPMSYNMSYGGKHYLHGLKQYDYDAFIEHQRKAGQQYAKNFTGMDKSWHVKGNKAGNLKRNGRIKYKLTTADSEEYIVNGIEMKTLCNTNNWNYETLMWSKGLGKVKSRGPLKGFKVEKLEEMVIYEIKRFKALSFS
jgi:hypothetical protein